MLAICICWTLKTWGTELGWGSPPSAVRQMPGHPHEYTWSHVTFLPVLPLLCSPELQGAPHRPQARKFLGTRPLLRAGTKTFLSRCGCLRWTEHVDVGLREPGWGCLSLGGGGTPRSRGHGPATASVSLGLPGLVRALGDDGSKLLFTSSRWFAVSWSLAP